MAHPCAVVKVRSPAGRWSGGGVVRIAESIGPLVVEIAALVIENRSLGTHRCVVDLCKC